MHRVLYQGPSCLISQRHQNVNYNFFDSMPLLSCNILYCWDILCAVDVRVIFHFPMTFSCSTKPLATKPKLCALRQTSWLHFLSAGASETHHLSRSKLPDSISSCSLPPCVSSSFGVTPNLEYVTQKNEVKSGGKEKWAASFLSANNSFSVFNHLGWRSSSLATVQTMARYQDSCSVSRVISFMDLGAGLRSCLGFFATTRLHTCCTCFVCMLKFCFIFIIWRKQGRLEVVRKIRNKCRFQLFLFLWSVSFI